MAGYLICICFESGVPIFARKIGDIAPIPFPLAASLNGVKVFGRGNRVELISTVTQSSRVVWKDFHDRLSLIFAGTDDSITDFHVEHVLVNVFSVLVLHTGLDEILKTKSVDKLKKEFRLCYPVIDLILQGLKPTDKTLYFGDLTGCADVALQMDSNYQGILDGFMEGIGGTYGCIVANGTIIASSKDWWTLSGTEMCLLTFTAAITTEPVTDTAIYLPSSSPKLPYRFATFGLSETVRLCVLCGQEPSMTLMEKEVAKVKKSSMDAFSMFLDKGFPFSNCGKFFAIDKTISGFVVVCLDKRRVAFSVFPDKENDPLNTAHKLDLLRTFYRNTVGSIFPWTCVAPPLFTSPALYLHPDAKDNGPTRHKAVESYWSSEYHKCHAITFAIFQLFVIYEPEVPRFLMRQTTRKLLQEVIKDRAMR